MISADSGAMRLLHLMVPPIVRDKDGVPSKKPHTANAFRTYFVNTFISEVFTHLADYIEEAEHGDGLEYWNDNFSSDQGIAGAVEDFSRYIKVVSEDVKS